MAHRQRNGRRRFDTPPDPQPTAEDLLRILRNQSIAKLEGAPPHEPAEALTIQHDMGYGKVFTRMHKGMTKRETVATQILASAVACHGLPLQDAEMLSMARRSLFLSEHFFQVLNTQREKDIAQMAESIAPTPSQSSVTIRAVEDPGDGEDDLEIEVDDSDDTGEEPDPQGLSSPDPKKSDAN